MEFLVTGCKDCPMLDSGAHHEYQCFCMHPKSPKQFLDREDYENYEKERHTISQIEVDEDWDRKPFHIPITPDWCPLNKESITIIKNNSQETKD